MNKANPFLLASVFVLVSSCTTLDKYDLSRDKIDGNNEKYVNVTSEVGVLDTNITSSMKRYNDYADEYTSIANFDKGIDFSVTLYFLTINTTASFYSYYKMTDQSTTVFGIGNIAGTFLLTLQTLLKATFYEQRKSQLEKKMITLSTALANARNDFLTIPDFSLKGNELVALQTKILEINSSLQEKLINDVQPMFSK